MKGKMRKVHISLRYWECAYVNSKFFCKNLNWELSVRRSASERDCSWTENLQEIIPVPNPILPSPLFAPQILRAFNFCSPSTWNAVAELTFYFETTLPSTIYHTRAHLLLGAALTGYPPRGSVCRGKVWREPTLANICLYLDEHKVGRWPLCHTLQKEGDI